MSEVLEIISEILLLGGLFYFAWKDYKTRLISAKALWIFGFMGIAVRFLTESAVQTGTGIQVQPNAALLWEILSGMPVGGILLLISVITRESIGIGDGLLFVCTGIFLDVSYNITLLLGSLFLAGMASLLCLLLKKKRKDERVAMGPFILAAYVMFIL